MRMHPLLLLALVSGFSSLAACATPFSSAIDPAKPPDEGPPQVEPNEPPVDVVRDPPAPRTELDFQGAFVRGAHERPAGGKLVVLERTVSLRALALDPDREAEWLSSTGAVEHRTPSLTEAGALLDAVVHPSGAVTALRVSERGFVVERYDAAANLRATFALDDPEIVTDPPALRPGESTSPVEENTHDVGGIDVDGEDVLVGTRTGRHSVIAYRVHWDAAAASFAVAARTLVVPAHPITPTGLNGGTYDTFGQLAAHYAVRVAVTKSGLGFVGVEHARFDPHRMLRAHHLVFRETLIGDPDGLDAYVTRVARDGVRLGTSVVSTENDDQLFGLRAIDDAAYAVGRTEHWNEQGTGFDALIARVDEGGTVTIRELAVDRGDVAFDVAREASGDLVVVGASGWWQNPHGASISEESSAFAHRLRADGSSEAIAIKNGPRHNEARFVLRLESGGLWIGGMNDGPGTHSADANERALVAHGFTTAGARPAR